MMGTVQRIGIAAETTVEGDVVQIMNYAGKLGLGQGTATRESIAAYRCHAAWNGNGGQGTATREGRTADAGHAGRDGNGGQARAAIEGRTTDTGHAVGNGDGGQASAVIVFITYCVSARFD